MNFSIFDDDCKCGGSCCGGQSDLMGALSPTNDTGGGDDGGGTGNCVTGTPYTDPNGVLHCLPGPAPTCPTGQHAQGNYLGQWICAPNTCPAGQHMGWSTDGSRVICSANDPITPTTSTCPAGYHLNPATGNCIRNVPIGQPAVNPPATQPAPTGLFGLSPLTLLLIAGGGIFLLSSMGDSKGGK